MGILECHIKKLLITEFENDENDKNERMAVLHNIIPEHLRHNQQLQMRKNDEQETGKSKSNDFRNR